MRIVVCVKQVPDTTDVRLDPVTNTLIREGVRSIVNPNDHFALEEALRLKREIPGTEVVLLSMGPPQARKALLRCLALGADRAYLMSDRAFAGSDTWATSYALSRGVELIGGHDLVLCGQQAIDGDTGQVGPEMAQFLGIPQATYAERIGIEGDLAIVEQQQERGKRILEVRLPMLVAMIPPPSYVPTFPSVRAVRDASVDKTLIVVGASDVGGDPAEMGLKGSPTQVLKTYSPPSRGQVRILRGDSRTRARDLVHELIGKGIVPGGDR